jgi:hypothetical protein
MHPFSSHEDAHKPEFVEGFEFCLRLLIGDGPPPLDLVENLIAVATGKLSLLPTIAEHRQSVERFEECMLNGLGDGEKELHAAAYSQLRENAIQGFADNRRLADAENVENAKMMLRVLGVRV